jgi:hypothetical protein
MTDPPIRASTMGFHDGVVSIGVMILSLLHAGVPDVLTSAIAASMAGALSMGLSEFQAVNTARDNDLKHEGAWKAAGSSFVSFVLGSAVPMMVVWYGGGFLDVLVSIFVALAATSVVNGANVSRSLSVTTVALVVSWLFGLLQQHQDV